MDRSKFEEMWGNFPPIEECTNMEAGSINFINKKINDIDERIITIDKVVKN